MLYFFQNIYTILNTIACFFYTEKIYYVDYDSEQDDEEDDIIYLCQCWSCNFYKNLHKFMYTKLNKYEK